MTPLPNPRTVAAIVMCAGLMLVGCGPTAHRPVAGFNQGPVSQAHLSEAPDRMAVEAGPSPLTREVVHQLSHGFWVAAPSCVLVLPAARSASEPQNTGSARMVERAVARHLHQKFDRVIGPDRREAMLHELVLDPTHPGDLERFGNLSGCRHVVRITPASEVSWTPIWTEARVSIALSLTPIDGDEVLWRAAHIARHGDGGLPLSPLSIVMATANAAALASDADLIPSLIEDAVRRTMRTLPDIRRMAAIQ